MDQQNNFGGFSDRLFDFFEGLEKDNSKTYWEKHHAIWEADVQQPLCALTAELEPEFGPLRTFRPNRDIRFSHDKSPYKTWAGITTTDRAVGGVGCFFRVEATGIRIACGAMVFAPDQLKRFRDAIVDDEAGAEFEQIKKELVGKALVVGPGREPTYKRTPTGYPVDHAREAILHWKGAIVIKEYERSAWMHTTEVIEKVYEVWQGAEPLREWIGTYVGPSTIAKRTTSGL